jgi:hypothetical protein
MYNNIKRNKKVIYVLFKNGSLMFKKSSVDIVLRTCQLCLFKYYLIATEKVEEPEEAPGRIRNGAGARFDFEF